MGGELFCRLFDGYEKRHLEIKSTGDKSKEGKLNTQTVDGPITRELAAAHLNGGMPIGVAPVCSDSTCMFGVLDVDWYDMPEDDVRLCADRLRTRCAAFRSKSRALNIYVFVDAPITGRLMHESRSVSRRPKGRRGKSRAKSRCICAARKWWSSARR